MRALLGAECPQWSSAPIEYLETSGTDNAMWRIRLDDEPDVVVRLPRLPGAAAGVEREIAVLQRIEGRLSSRIATPSVRHLGEPHERFPHRWSVLEWIDGTDAWTGRDELVPGQDERDLARDLAEVVTALTALVDLRDIDQLKRRSPGNRGGPLEPLLDRLEGWLTDPQWNAPDLVDVASIRRLADESREVIGEPATEGFVHGDLIPGNLLVDRGRLTAVIDWGGVGIGDTAQDLAPAWAVLSKHGRAEFAEAVGVDRAGWIRGRAFELEHAVGGVLYYIPRGHTLGDVMARTLTRILTDR